MFEKGSTYQYYKKTIKNEQLPTVLCNKNLLDENIKIIQKKAKNKKIRLATKSIRCQRILKYILEASDQFQGLMCFSGEEAIYLFDLGFDDILLGYPVVDKNCIRTLIKKKKKIVFMIDLIEHLEVLEDVGKELEMEIKVCMF